MKEQALIGARGLVSPSLCIPVLQSVSCYRGAAVMPFSRRLWRVLGEVGLAVNLERILGAMTRSGFVASIRSKLTAYIMPTLGTFFMAAAWAG